MEPVSGCPEPGETKCQLPKQFPHGRVGGSLRTHPGRMPRIQAPLSGHPPTPMPCPGTHRGHSPREGALHPWETPVLLPRPSRPARGPPGQDLWGPAWPGIGLESGVKISIAKIKRANFGC